MVMDRSAVDTVLAIPTCAIKLENPSSPASLASNGQFPFTPSEISGLRMDTSVIDSTYSSHLENSEELQLGPDVTGQPKEFLQLLGQNPWNPSLSDVTADWSNLQGEMWLSLSKALPKLFCWSQQVVVLLNYISLFCNSKLASFR